MITVVLLMFVVSRFMVKENLKDHHVIYEVRIISYDGGYNSFVTNDYEEVDGCVEFEINSGEKKKICEDYTIVSWR